MAQVKFYRGLAAKYNSTTHAEGIYFATDEHLIYLNGVAYGFNASKVEAVKDVTVSGNVITVSYIDGSASTTININEAIVVDGTSIVKEVTTNTLKSGLTLKSVTASGNNAASYQLQDGQGNVYGDTINIAKDQHLKSVDLVSLEAAIEGVGAAGDDALKFVWFIDNEGTIEEKTTYINVASFLRESEKGDGLQVVNGVISVKKDADSEAFLSVGANGVKISGVQSAINTAQAAAEATAAADATSKANAAQAAAEATAAADATSKANAAESNAKSYADGLSDAIKGTDASAKDFTTLAGIKKVVEGLDAEKEGSLTSGVKVKVTQVDGAITGVEVTDNGLATAISTAQSNAEATAAADATSKANTAESNAKSYCDTALLWNEVV